MEIIYMLNLNNYQGETTFELFHQKNNAEQRYNELIEENKDQDEFEYYNKGQGFSFFNPSYNEYSTFITLVKTTLDQLFED